MINPNKATIHPIIKNHCHLFFLINLFLLKNKNIREEIIKDLFNNLEGENKEYFDRFTLPTTIEYISDYCYLYTI